MLDPAPHAAGYFTFDHCATVIIAIPPPESEGESSYDAGDDDPVDDAEPPDDNRESESSEVRSRSPRQPDRAVHLASSASSHCHAIERDQGTPGGHL